MAATAADTRGDAAANSLGGQYEKLLATVGSLQGDLQRTVGVCQALSNQNDKLKANYEAVRAELIQLREKHNATRVQLLEAVENRVDADQRTETLVYKWKVQLEARTRELEALQAKLVPQDLDILRAKVQEELEVPHQRRVGLLEAEVDKHRQMFFGVRREYERCKAEYEQYTIDQGREMEASHQQHIAESHALKLRIQDLEGSFADAARDEELRLLRRQLDEAEAMKAQVHAEMAAVRSQKEAAELERHKLMLAHQSETAALHMKASNLEADKQVLQRRCADVEDLAGRRRRQSEEARDRLQDALEELCRLKEACSGKDRIALEARAEAKHAAERLATEWGREKAELKAGNEALVKRVAMTERRCREISEQAAERVRGAQQMEERVLHKTDKEARVLREALGRLEAEVERLRNEAEREGSTAQQEIQRRRGDADRAKSEASRTFREKEALRERIAALQSGADRSVEAAAEMARERDEARLAAVAASQRTQQERDATAEVEGENEGLRTRLQMMEKDMAILAGEADQAREAHVRALKDIKRAACAERDSHMAHAHREVENIRRRARRAVHKERKRSRAYKAQAIEAHKRGLRARNVLKARASAAAMAATASLTRVGRGAAAEGVGLGMEGGAGMMGQAEERRRLDSMSSTLGMVFDGSSTSPAAAKTTEALELSQALRRVRATRRSRRHSGGDDERTRRRNARSAAGTDATGDARPQSRTQGMQPLKGGGGGENGGQEDQREGGSGGGESGFGATEGFCKHEQTASPRDADQAMPTT